MSLSVAGVWAVDTWSQTVWADGVWREGEAVITEITGGVNSRKIKYENITPIWKQNEEKTDWVDKEIVRERKKLKLHKPNIINVAETVDEQIKEIYTAQAVKSRIKKKRRNKAIAMILRVM